MKEHPILFIGPMIRRVLSGQKKTRPIYTSEPSHS